MSCLICGSRETVRSHIIPKSLVFRIRGSGKHAVRGARDRLGTEFTQSGSFDDTILCAKHEAMLGKADDYAVRFCRDYAAKGTPSASGKATEITNPKPQLLVDFAYATVWRQAVSHEGRRFGLTLGPYKTMLEDHLFSGKSTDLSVIVSRPHLIGTRGDKAEIGIPPYRRRLKRWNVIHFHVGGFDFLLKTDSQPFPREWKPLLANNNDPIVCVNMDPTELANVPMLQDLFANMVRR